MPKRFTKKAKTASSTAASSDFTKRQLDRAKRALRKRRRDKSHQ